MGGNMCFNLGFNVSFSFLCFCWFLFLLMLIELNQGEIQEADLRSPSLPSLELPGFISAANVWLWSSCNGFSTMYGQEISLGSWISSQTTLSYKLCFTWKNH